MASVGILVKTAPGIQVEKAVVHELGHFIGNLSDTNNYFSGLPENVMQYNGARSANTEFRCRNVQQVTTGTGFPPLGFESQWNDSIR